MSQKTMRLRWLAEAAVVVASVLFAFAIEAWWSGRGEQAEVDALVSVLRADIAQNLMDMEAAHDRAETGLESLDALLDVIQRSRPAPSPDSMVILLASTFRTNQLKPQLASFDAAVGTRAWDDIPVEVKIELTLFKNVNWSSQEVMQQEAMTRYLEIATQFGGLPALLGQAGESSPFRPDYEGLLLHPGFESWVWMFVGIEQNFQQDREEWLDRLREVDQRLASH